MKGGEKKQTNTKALIRKSQIRPGQRITITPEPREKSLHSVKDHIIKIQSDPEFTRSKRRGLEKHLD